jgi:hypothetical protein
MGSTRRYRLPSGGPGDIASKALGSTKAEDTAADCPGLFRVTAEFGTLPELTSQVSHFIIAAPVDRLSWPTRIEVTEFRFARACPTIYNERTTESAATVSAR